MDTDKFRIKSWSQVHVQGRGSAMPLVLSRRVLAKFVNEFVVFFVHYCDHIRVGMMQDCTLFYLKTAIVSTYNVQACMDSHFPTGV